MARRYTGRYVDAVAKVLDPALKTIVHIPSVNSHNDLIEHPQLRTRRMPIGLRSVEVPAIPWASEWDSESYRAAPAVDEHGAAIRAEFAAQAAAPQTTAAK